MCLIKINTCLGSIICILDFFLSEDLATVNLERGTECYVVLTFMGLGLSLHLWIGSCYLEELPVLAA